MSKLTELEQVIGYEFNEQRLLQQALTHSSFANEKHMKKLSDNERLEFLGDAVLEVVSSEFLYKEHTDLPEGDLTKLRASIVCEPTLAPVSYTHLDVYKRQCKNCGSYNKKEIIPQD